MPLMFGISEGKQADGVSPSFEVFFPTVRGNVVLDGRRKGDGPWGEANDVRFRLLMAPASSFAATTLIEKNGARM